jgi:adenylate cyclase class 2
MAHIETEVKFYLDDIKLMHQRLTEMGAASRGRFFERNLRFEDSQRSLKTKKSLLRLRQDKSITLTFKSPLVGSGLEFKKMAELEVEVSDFDVMNGILQALGFHCEQTYEKWRETLVLEDTQFCLDAMPFGNFLEIEGQAADIKKYASGLGLQWRKRILLNYLEIFEIIKEKKKLGFKNLTFDNFKNIKVDIADYLKDIEAKNVSR